MPFVTRRSAFALAALGIAGCGAVAGAVWSGLYDIGADAPHTRPVHSLLQAVRERSIAVRAAGLAPPDLRDAARVRHGAGNYAHMCASCHRAPGGGSTELSRGLYPAPPDLTRAAGDARAAFWVIKHGIKGSGMPAWGRSMDDDSMWSLVAFLQALPRLDAPAYATLVADSGGHAHGSGVAGGADAAAAAATADGSADGHVHRHDAAPDLAPAPGPTPAPKKTTTHVHADGQSHEHPAEPPPVPADPPPADPHDHGGHEHPHP